MFLSPCMNNSILITSRLLAFTLLLQAMELWLLMGKAEFTQVWSFENLKSDVKWKFLFSELSFKVIVLMQIAAAVVGFIHPQPISMIALFITHLLICIRFRGSFNGGSDMMAFVILTGMLIAHLSSHPEVQEFGLVYIAVHALYSYFKAGVAKIKHKEWRAGSALQSFLKMSLYPEIRQITLPRGMGRVLCWLVLVFELSAVALPFFPQIVPLYFVAAIVFHLAIYVTFGLNRFFWIWMCAWPAIFYFTKALEP